MKYIKKHPILVTEELEKGEIVYKNDKIGVKVKEVKGSSASNPSDIKDPQSDSASTPENITPTDTTGPKSGSASTPENITPTDTTGPKSGSASNTSQNQGASASNTSQTQGASASTPLTINGLFSTIFKQEERQKWEMSDEDYKKMEYIDSQDVESWSYTPDDTDKDPIIKIVELFQQAHQLYFTPQIPTGRPLGKVSQKTWLEYTYVGKEPGGGQWREDSAPSGPFIVNSIFNKWRDGIEKIFQDKQMRKIFANAKFKVKNTTIVEEPNKQTKLESVQFINEAENSNTPTGNDKQGQIIFTFMRNMLDKNKLADFDGNKNKLMYDYFGIKGDSVDKITYNGINKPNKRDTDPNELRWQTTDCKYNELDKKIFLLAMNNETIYFCVGLGHQKDILPTGYKKDAKRVNGTFFYYWQNDDKEIRDWAKIKYPKLKLQIVLDKLNTKKQEGIGFLDSLNDSNDTIKKNQCEWYLMKSPGSKDYKYVDVEKFENKYPTKKVGSQLDKPLKKYDRDLVSYMQLTDGSANYHSSEELYNNHIGSLTNDVKEKFKKAVLERKNQSDQK